MGKLSRKTTKKILTELWENFVTVSARNLRRKPFGEIPGSIICGITRFTCETLTLADKVSAKVYIQALQNLNKY